MGLKLHEDWGTTPAAIDCCLTIAEEEDIQVNGRGKKQPYLENGTKLERGASRGENVDDPLRILYTISSNTSNKYAWALNTEDASVGRKTHSKPFRTASS